jgi:hypothetical protein
MPAGGNRKGDRMQSNASLRALIAAAVLCVATTAQAQDSPWSVEIGIGFDNSISGNINSGAIGTLNNQTVVFLKNSYEDVYGTGLHLRFGGGYMFRENTEVRAVFTFQSLDADLVPMGDYTSSRLYGQYSDYQSFGLDVGLRRYANAGRAIRPYGEGYIGLGFVDKTDITLAAPQANVQFDANDFYDQTTAFTFGINAGLLWEVRQQMGVYGQLGFRYVTGMSEVDDFVGTGLDSVNDDSARWTIPFVVGVQFRF